MLLPTAHAADALQLQLSDAQFSHGVFHVQFEAVLEAPAAGIAAVLTDFERLGRLDPRIQRTEVLGRSPEGDVLVRTLVEACAGPFCRSVVRVERIDREPGELLATVVPDRSDLRQGSFRTYWEELGPCTRVRYEADFEPAFWVPGLVGELYATGALRASTVRVFERVERLANGR
ncbi:MAG TPA: SRPBCC family protein [Steroidobacteraceae bacterium]|nr:SRPBCC family protein [Steroidobacteraceae bacterium]